MNILVTGAAGFLGSHFSRAIRERWPDARLVLNDLDDLRIESIDGSIVWGGDIVWAIEHMPDLGGPFDVVYHFAAPVGGRAKIEGDPLYNADSLRIDSALFRWAAAGHARTVVYPSSSAVYPVALQRKETGKMLAESHFQVDQDHWGAPDEMYGFTKMAGEVLAWKSAAYGLRTLCIRPFSGYGPGQAFAYPFPALAKRVIERQDPLQVWGSGGQVRDPIHVDDIVAATFARLDAGIGGYETMNIASGTAMSFIGLARAYADLEGYRPRIEPIGGPEGVYWRVGDTTIMRRYHKPTMSLGPGLQTILDNVRARM